MTHASLFTGIGGFDLAASRMGWQNVFQCEIDPFCQRVLKYHFPECKLFSDIKTSDFTNYANRIDILTGGFPCQPFSVAGKRKGTDDNRYLWPEMLRAIREIQPLWVVAENVGGILTMQSGMVFERVCADMEDAGYTVQPFVVPACAVGAPHRRDRVWIVARTDFVHAAGHRSGQAGCADGTHQSERDVADNGAALRSCRERVAADTDSARFTLWEESLRDEEQKWIRLRIDRLGAQRHASDTAGTGLSATTEVGSMERGRFGIDNHRGVWDDFPAQSPVCSRNDGFPDRMDGITFSKWRSESIKAFGNAIVPQIAYQIFRAIETVELHKNKE